VNLWRTVLAHRQPGVKREISFEQKPYLNVCLRCVISVDG